MSSRRVGHPGFPAIWRAALGVVGFVASSSSSAAQGWTGGIKGGVGQGGFTGTTEFAWQPSAGTAGVFFTRPYVRGIALQPELLLTQKIGVSTVSGTSLTFRGEYLHVPLLLRLELPGVAAARPYLLGGPGLVFQLRCRLRFVTGGLVSSNNCEDNPSSLHQVDVAVEFGGGVNWTVGATALVLEGRAAGNLRSVIVPLESRRSRSVGWSVLAGVSRPVRRPAVTRPGVVSPVPVPVPRSLPPLGPIRMDVLAEPRAAEPAPAPASTTRSEPRISITAVDADVRPLLVGIAREAGINLVVSNDVRRRVSLTLTDVPAMEALAAIVAEAGLSVANPQSSAPWPAVVYYQLPIDVNQASAVTIAARFGVSTEMAKWIIESRPEKPVKP